MLIDERRSGKVKSPDFLPVQPFAFTLSFPALNLKPEQRNQIEVIVLTISTIKLKFVVTFQLTCYNTDAFDYQLP